MSIASAAVPPPDRVISPRRATADEIRRICNEARNWRNETSNVRDVVLYTHESRPTIRCVINSIARDYDSQLDEAVTELDLGLARNPDLTGIDVEVRLFFAPGPEHIAAWVRGWQPWTDA